MKRITSLPVRNSLLIGLLAVSTGLFSQAAAAGGQYFGSGAPKSSAELPAGELRKSIESLPAATQARALQWLQSIEFTGQDLSYLKVDRQGSIYYADTYMTKKASGQNAATAGRQGITSKNVFRLHSKPGAANTIFVDFDGASISGTAWNKQVSASELMAKPYDADGNPDAFSSAEISDMAEIWERVAEDFAPFDVDVTTEDPGKNRQNVAWVVVTDSDPGGKQPLPSPKAGSTTYMNIYGFSHTAYFSPALIYSNNLGSASAVAEASSHSIGHIMGLSHDTTVGTGKGMVSWAPIMGVNHTNQVTQWSKGDYRGAVNKQDDIGILVGALGLRRDDHDDSRFDSGTPLVSDRKGNIAAINPGIDPSDHNSENKGLIEDEDDIDVFVFNAGKGVVDITVTPAWQAYQQDSHRGANLDVHVSLYDANGKKIAESDPGDETSSRLRKKVSPGRYKLEIRGTGNKASDYPRYGSIGQYYIAGKVPPSGSNSTTLAKTGK
ncbi:MAG TPA: hypothetical protein VET88_00750 [Gammaproteobacteria bacterium]|nr:hypothetical protein [Gammaproteobacteria bacterium]